MMLRSDQEQIKDMIEALLRAVERIEGNQSQIANIRYEVFAFEYLHQ